MPKLTPLEQEMLNLLKESRNALSSMASLDLRDSVWERIGAVIAKAQPKPITQEQITAALCPVYCAPPIERAKYVNFLRNLGIDVED